MKLEKAQTERWLPVKGIQNGEIILDNGVRVTGVKVRPRNIFILDYDSQSNAIFNLRNFCENIAKEPILCYTYTIIVFYYTKKIFSSPFSKSVNYNIIL